MYRLIVVKGPNEGKSYEMNGTAMKLGRSSQCDIALDDPEMSRSHCYLEIRDGELWVADLGSANQTFVNGKAVDECALKNGDEILVGTTKLRVESDATDVPAGAISSGEEPVVDLGFEHGEEDAAAPKKNAFRPLIWAVCAILVLVLAAMCIFDPSLIGLDSDADKKKVVIAPPKVDKNLSIQYEKIEADTNNIFRFELTIRPSEEKQGTEILRVQIDDLADSGRHIRKEKELSAAQIDELIGIVESSGFFGLEKAYSGFAKPNTLNSYSLLLTLGKKVYSCKVENHDEPEPFKALRQKLETYSKNELGIWAIQFSTDKLMELATESRQIGLKKYTERDVTYGNLFESLRAYHDAIFYLDTVNPKPDIYPQLIDEFEQTKSELNKRYEDQRFLANRAINLKEWTTAVKELRIIMEMIPDREDARNKEAAQKLLDVENRIKTKR
ncbi:MAG: FHA domain-containing protein [Kiritimatiellae bacterium]|nr:FHA domain-containing protein [Kiritimatiellia bacterium]